MHDSNTVFVGLDVHKNSIEIAIAESGRSGEVRHYRSVGGDLLSFGKAVRKLRSRHADLHFVYEAGPCGYEVYRYLADLDLMCDVIAPSLIPRKAGDRVKTDRRDAIQLARMHRAGELSPIYVPHPEDEAIRDLVRCREDARIAQRKARQQLKALLLRNGIRYEGRSSWIPAHLRWLSELKMPLPAQQIAFQEYLDTITSDTARIERLEQQIRDQVAGWKMRPVVEALQALRGVQLITAATLVAELGDLRRFDNPRQLMAYVGLVPGEHSSGERRRLGGITKAGNTHVRRVLIESAWAYRLPARVSRIIRKRQESLPQKIVAISWQAQLRLCSRYRKLMAAGKCKQQTVAAIARELTGYVWAIVQEVKLS